MDMRLEVVVVPVSDVDRAKDFYADRMGFHVDIDNTVGERMRVVQLTPPGSACSITLGKGFVDMAPGTLKGLQLVVGDVASARDELLARGVQVSEVQHVDTETGSWAPGPGGNYNSFVFFSDPDGNAWTIQEVAG
jgi:catechol 2,3-dioxygenase-like lactoylglutathione lyase family enzyme